MIEISDKASAQINEMILDLNSPGLFLRVGVVDGGCSGLSYDLRYKDQGMTGGFTMDNPNVKASCGCGASFRTAAYRGKAQKC
ncbi:iron-sulfur cluster assembly accessory protein [Cohnella thailandensis]|uniref:Iron-sulfur cluster assembly accessory protein n=2 Tax=Cohnella thailandensis TaxID=557557 RepID=A0A841SYB4_9BACL|nr:iron-sulfur cluster assembly accessory protein [Cohnella thailandensis]MBB6634587.1 iron-sulfur cluster assembly accessory protein [Cohnella thailandensis]